MALLMRVLLLSLAVCQVTAAKDAITPELDSENIPRQMRQLYHQYKHGHSLGSHINTVRYIQAHKGSITSKGYLLFNLDAIHKKETLQRAELHFFRRNNELDNPLQLDFTEVSPYYFMPVQREVVAAHIQGWTVVSVTTTAQSCVNTIQTNHQVGVKFSLQTGDKVEAVHLEQFLRHHSLPFLMIYSNDSQSIDMDQIKDRSHLSVQAMAEQMNNFVDPATGHRISSADFKGRSKRDISNNDFFEYLDVEKRKSLDRKTNEIPSISHADSAFSDDKLSYMNELTNELASTNNEQKTLTIKQTLKMKERERLKEKKRRRKEQRRNKKLRKERKQNTSPSSGSSNRLNVAQEIDNMCSRKRLSMNFEDLGWHNRIIEPKMFEAYYCSGQCNFPFSLGLKPTNHATLQSLLNAVNVRENIPQPCCVPDKMSAVTLLYTNDEGNVVLKQYPDMSVDSCACR